MLEHGGRVGHRGSIPWPGRGRCSVLEILSAREPKRKSYQHLRRVPSAGAQAEIGAAVIFRRW
jgi:hypothetical protein